MHESFMSKVVDSTTHYSNFELIGKHPAPKYPDLVNYEMPLSNLSVFIDLSDQEWLKSISGDFVISKSTNRTLDLSVRKMDVLPIYEYMFDPDFDRAYDFVSEMYSSALTATPWNVEETLEDLDLSKASGAIYTASGYRTKADLVSDGFIPELLNLNITAFRPIWKASGKVELRDRSKYVVDESQRTFIIEPFESLFHRKRLFGQQNHNLKNVGWSSYGFNPYDGGVNRLGHKLSHFRRKMEWDAVKWDRRIPHMREVCALRTTHLMDNDDGFLPWVVDSLCDSVVLLPNGDLIFKSWGNNSGSGTTTGDNILAMNIIIAHAIYRVHRAHGKKPPHFSVILKSCFYATFGDDVVGGDNFEFSDEAMYSFFLSTFHLYGIELDPLVITNNVEDLHFLGFRFKNLGGSYIPEYNLGRIVSSFYQDSEKATLSGEFSKMTSLMLLSAGHGQVVFDRLRSIVLDVLTSCRSKELDTYRLYELPTFEQTINWYLGHEGSGSCFLFFRTSLEPFNSSIRWLEE